MGPWQNIAALLQDRARRDPDRELFRFEGVSWTVGQIDQASSRLAHVLGRRGIRKGDRVALRRPDDAPTDRQLFPRRRCAITVIMGSIGIALLTLAMLPASAASYSMAAVIET